VLPEIRFRGAQMLFNVPDEMVPAKSSSAY
jgi:hypothetical protein